MADINTIRFIPGKPLLKEITADRLNSILAEIRRNKPVGERGITVRQSANATYIGLAKPTTTEQKPPREPWSLTATKDPQNEDQYVLKVVPGTLNNILPANWDGEFVCNNTDVYYAKAVIATDGNGITGVSIEIDTDAPGAQQPQAFAIDEAIDYLFGLFFDGTVYRVIPSGHIQLSPQEWLVKSKNPPAEAGALPYEVMYTLTRP